MNLQDLRYIFQRRLIDEASLPEDSVAINRINFEQDEYFMVRVDNDLFLVCYDAVDKFIARFIQAREYNTVPRPFILRGMLSGYLHKKDEVIDTVF